MSEQEDIAQIPHVQLSFKKTHTSFFNPLWQAFTRLKKILIKREKHHTPQRLKIAGVDFSTPAKNNEQLEFLGDSVLNMVITEYLMAKFPKKPEGFLSRLKSYAVSRKALYYVATQLKLYQIFKCDTSLMHTLPYNDTISPLTFSSFTRHTEPKIHAPLANAVESLIGAVYISQGLKITRQFIITRFTPIIDSVVEGKHHRDYKSILQHYTQSTYGVKPIYTVMQVSGPDHKKKYIVAVNIEDGEQNIVRSFSSYEAHNKKQAEQDAAKTACRALKVEENEMLF